MPAKKDGIAGYLSQTTQEIADQIAKNLVDRALELDRKRLVKKLNHPAAQNGAFLGAPASSAGAPLILWLLERGGGGGGGEDISFLSILSDLEAKESKENQ